MELLLQDVDCQYPTPKKVQDIDIYNKFTMLQIVEEILITNYEPSKHNDDGGSQGLQPSHQQPPKLQNKPLVLSK